MPVRLHLMWRGFFWGTAYIALLAGGFWAFDAVAQEAASFKEDVFSTGRAGKLTHARPMEYAGDE